MLLLLSVVLAAAPFEQAFPNAKLFVRPGESTLSTAIGLDVPFTELTAEAARTFLISYGGAFGLREEDELVLRSRRGDRLLTTLRFERRKAGVPVYGAELILTFDGRAHLTMIHAGPQVPPARGGWKLPAAYALEQEPGASHAEAAWVRHGEALRPAWIVTRVLPEGPTAWLSVDAENGRVLERRRIAWTVDGTVFDYSPVRSQGALCTQAVDAGYTPCAATSVRTLGNLNAGASTLSGPRVVARNCQGQASGTNCLPRATPNGAGHFDYPADLTTSNTDSFGEVMAYYQADRFSSWLDTLSPAFQGLGVVDVFTNIGGYEGGFFQAAGPFNRFGIRLGQGPLADWAYDGDVLWHEMGHGLVERTSGFGFYRRDGQGIDGDSGSLNEGTADCTALAFKGSPQLGENAGSRLLEDGQTSGPYLRTVENKRTCQISSIDSATLAIGGRVGEIHVDGIIWGSFFWTLRQRMASISTAGLCVNCNAAEVTLTRALESLGPSASFNDATLAVQQVAASVFGAQAAQLVGCMSCEWDMPGCADRSRAVFPGETHEALLVDSSAGSYGGVTPATFQYVLAVPANTQVNFNRFVIESGSLSLLARFGGKVSWNGTTHNATHTITAQGQALPAQASAGNWYLQGAHDGAAIRRFGFRVNFNPAGPPPPARLRPRSPARWAAPSPRAALAPRSARERAAGATAAAAPAARARWERAAPSPASAPAPQRVQVNSVAPMGVGACAAPARGLSSAPRQAPAAAYPAVQGGCAGATAAAAPAERAVPPGSRATTAWVPACRASIPARGWSVDPTATAAPAAPAPRASAARRKAAAAPPRACAATSCVDPMAWAGAAAPARPWSRARRTAPACLPPRCRAGAGARAVRRPSSCCSRRGCCGGGAREHGPRAGHVDPPLRERHRRVGSGGPGQEIR